MSASSCSLPGYVTLDTAIKRFFSLGGGFISRGFVVKFDSSKFNKRGLLDLLQ